MVRNKMSVEYDSSSLIRITLLVTILTLSLGLGVTTAESSQSDSEGVIGEVGVTTVDQPDRDTFFTVDLQHTYENPVVVMKPVGSVGPHPAHIRLKNVQSESFEYQVEEWSSTDGPHNEVRVSYIVVEAGQHSLDGKHIEAGTVQTDHEFTTVQLMSEFTDVPVAFTQSQTENGGDNIVTRNQVRENGSFDSKIQTRVQEAEGADGKHALETVGYIAIEPGTGADETVPFEVGRTGETVSDQPEQITFAEPFDQTPRFIADMQTINGNDTAQTRLESITDETASVFIEEETTGDRETGHTTESVGYLAIGDAGTLQGDATASQEPAVMIDDVSTVGPVSEAEPITVTAEISAEGGISGSQTVSLEIPGIGTTDVSATVESGQSTSVKLTVPTSTDDAGTYNATVWTANDSESQQVIVEPQSTEPKDPEQCQPSAEEPQMQAVQLHTDETEIKQGDPGTITGSIATEITNNCPVKVQLTLQVPSGVSIEGGRNIQSGSGGIVTSTFVVEPGEVKGISADVITTGSATGDKQVQSSITYFPVGHQNLAKEQNTGTLQFTASETTQSDSDTGSATDDGSNDGSDRNSDRDSSDDSDSSVSVEIPGFTPITAVVALISMLLALNRHN